MILYLITNTITGKRYVGQTIDKLERRWQKHCANKKKSYLQKAIAKYGKENFCMEALIEDVPTREMLSEFEKEYIVRYCTLVPNGYNLTSGGESPQFSAESRLKMSIGARKSRSKESIEKTAQSLRGRKRPPEVGKKIGETKRRNHLERVAAGLAEDYRQKSYLRRSESHKGKPWSLARRQAQIDRTSKRRIESGT